MFDANYGKVTTFFVLHAGFEVAEKYKDFIRIETYDDCMGINYEHCVEAYLSKIMNWEGKE